MLQTIGPMREVLSKPVYSRQTDFIHKAIHLQSPLLSRIKIHTNDIAARLKTSLTFSTHPIGSIASRKNERSAEELSKRLDKVLPKEQFYMMLAHCLLPHFDEYRVFEEILPLPPGLPPSRKFISMAKEIGEIWDVIPPTQKLNQAFSSVLSFPKFPESGFFSHSDDSQFSMGKLVRLAEHEEERIERVKLICAFKRGEVSFEEFKQSHSNVYEDRLTKVNPTTAGVELIGKNGRLGIIGGSEKTLEAYLSTLDLNIQSLAVRLGASPEEIKDKSIRKDVQKKISVGPQKKEIPAFRKTQEEKPKKKKGSLLVSENETDFTLLPKKELDKLLLEVDKSATAQLAKAEAKSKKVQAKVKRAKAPKEISSPKLMADVRTSSEYRQEIMNWLSLDPEYSSLNNMTGDRDQRIKETSKAIKLFGSYRKLSVENKEALSQLLDSVTAERLITIDFEKERIALLKKLEAHFGDEFPEAQAAYSRFVRAEENALKQRERQKRPSYEIKMARRIGHEELRAKPGTLVRNLAKYEIPDSKLKVMLAAARSPKQKSEKDEEWEMAQDLTKSLEKAGVDVEDPHEVIAAFARAAVRDLGTPARTTIARAERPKYKRKKRAPPTLEEEEDMLLSRAERPAIGKGGVRTQKRKKEKPGPLAMYFKKKKRKKKRDV